MVDRVDELVAQPAPIELGLDGEFVPSGADKLHGPVRPGLDRELAARGSENPIEMRRAHPRVGRDLRHWHRLLRDVKGEPFVLDPRGYGLDEVARRKTAIADRAHAHAVDARARGIGDAHAENPIGRLRDGREGDDLAPHLGRIACDRYRSRNLPLFRRAGERRLETH